MTDRLPTHIEVSGLILAVQNAGGFATVLAKGERDAGTLLIVTLGRGGPDRLYERMPQLDGSRPFTVTREQDIDNPLKFNEYLTKRRQQDPDIWIVELDIADAERFAALQHK
ncbi:DUF1491 family protein [Altererythrobacter sp. RZ02]|uniref:DUF1491 family protein n=1 Tax=Pontixanthobacter rizhaonensis TaxID=2730337 RepID=A0A848QP53_9SPHN|nr:DUF1491 family protein [Pontixanthobacter rizhaonensis]NMW32669.1 DUF1491 family protein [Pontixanthobacter rizhaonensis]